MPEAEHTAEAKKEVSRTTEDPHGDIFPEPEQPTPKIQQPNRHIVRRYNAYAANEELDGPTAALLVIAELIFDGLGK